MAKYKLHFYDDCIECCNKVLSVNSGLMQVCGFYYVHKRQYSSFFVSDER